MLVGILIDLTLYGHIKAAEQRTIIQPGRAATPLSPSSLYQMLQPTHQRPVFQLHII